MLLLYVLTLTGRLTERGIGSDLRKEIRGVKIEVTKEEVTENSLELEYEIMNDADDDAWVLVGTQVTEDSENAAMNADVFMADDGHTLMIRRRLDLPTLIAGPPFYGRYVRLRAGESQTECLFVKLPVHPRSQFQRVMRQEQGLEYATRVGIELGYYPGNLPEMIFSMFGETVNYAESPTRSGGLLGVASSLNSWNEHLTSRDEEFLLPYNRQRFKDEQVLRTAINDVRIPYVERDISARFQSLDLTSCTKIEIQYQPSMLEYYFPYASQQSLLSFEEINRLRSEKTLVVEGAQELKAIADDVANAVAVGHRFDQYISGGLVRYRSKVDVVCLHESKPSISFSVYKDNTIVAEGNRGICYEGFPSLKMLAPLVPALSLRTKCAANLKNLWYRLRFFYRAEATRLRDASIKRETTYPTPTAWCDDMLRPFYPAVEGLPLPVISNWDAKTHICPGASEGKSHYAMNPNCRPDSPPDMVLLFETNAGWNQHGGPELFTFDNHDPKGGCVLLNDGTVKFIRTTEELQQLRWK